MPSFPVLIAAELEPLLDAEQQVGLDVTWVPTEQPTPPGAHVALVPLAARWVGGTQLKRLPNLKLVANCGAGADNVDLVAAELRGVIVTDGGELAAQASADLTWSLIIACARRSTDEVALSGRTLGLIGAGPGSLEVGRRARESGLRVMNADPGAELRPLLAASDIVSLHAHLGPHTRGLIGPETLAFMKPGAVLVNAASGALVREDPLAQALEEGRLGGAGLAVHEEAALAPRLRAAPGLVLLPQLGDAAPETRRALARLALANVHAVLGGRAPLTPVFP